MKTKASGKLLRLMALVLVLALGAVEGTALAAGPLPEAIPEPERILQDADSSLRAYERRTISGDNILNNLYERPFTAGEMAYLKDVDIFSASIASDDAFYYFTIALQGGDEATGGLTGSYGIEFDRTKTGRGDLLVLAGAPGTDWSMDDIMIFTDANKDVGGEKPILAETGFSGDGYDTQAAPGAENAVYARQDPADDTAIQIAISKALLEGTDEFLWNAWALKPGIEAGKFDFNDVFGPSEAGSPIKPSADYPLAALNSLDNTCRLPYGFASAGGIAGMCLSFPKPEKKSKDGCPWELTPIYFGNTVKYVCVNPNGITG